MKKRNALDLICQCKKKKNKEKTYTHIYIQYKEKAKESYANCIKKGLKITSHMPYLKQCTCHKIISLISISTTLSLNK